MSDDADQMATSAYGYNPIFQKRISFGIDRNPGGYHWYGPPPDMGASYGAWMDPKSNVGAIAPIAADHTMLYSPATGEEMTYEGPASTDMREAVLSYQGDFHLMPVTLSGHACLTSAPIYGDHECPTMHNPFTGEDITEEYRAMKTTKKIQTTAAKNSYKPLSVEIPKIGQSAIPHSKDAKMIDHSKADKGKLADLGAQGNGEKDKTKTVPQSGIKPIIELKAPDLGTTGLPHLKSVAENDLLGKSVDAMTDDELVEALEAHLAKADDESSAPKIEIELSSPVEDDTLPEASPPSDEESPVVPTSEMPEGEEPKDESMEPSIPVLEEPASSMPYAHAMLVRRLQTTAAALRAGVKIDQADQDAMITQATKILRASRNTDDVLPVVPPRRRAAVDSTAQSEILKSLQQLSRTVAALGQKVEALQPPALLPAVPKASEMPEVKPAKSDSDPEKKVEDIMKDESAEGVHFEVLQSLDDLEQEGITASSINCTLYAEGGVNPFWNVTVHGEPLARIYLQDQERPDEIKALFCSPMYSEAIAKASEQVEGGLRRLLKDANARLFIMQLDKVQIATEARVAAQQAVEATLQERVTTLSDRFLEAMATAAIGMDRNFFGRNPLKGALSAVMHEHGIPITQTVEIIEASFGEGSAEYFKALAQKASELMAMEPVAFNQLRAAILESGTIKPVVAATESQPNTINTLTQHLAEQSASVAGIGMMHFGSEPLTEKEQLRRDLGLSKR